MTCTNPSSGATWQIHVDYGGHTVDSNPAVITNTVIEWQSNGWKYSLDRKLGKLTVVVASLLAAISFMISANSTNERLLAAATDREPR